MRGVYKWVYIAYLEGLANANTNSTTSFSTEHGDPLEVAAAAAVG